jgi:hypothetical protein
MISVTTAIHGGDALAPGRLTVLRGPRLTVRPEKGEYTLEINFGGGEVAGTTVIESSSGGRKSSATKWQADPLFDSYRWRDQWHQPVLRGSFKGATIRGQWSRPRVIPPDGRCAGDELEAADLRVEWSLTKVR